MSTERIGADDILPGKLLSAGKEDAAMSAMAIWASKDKVMRRQLAQWECNVLRRQGYKNVKIMSEGDDRSWRAWMPAFMKSNPNSIKAFNLAAMICRKQTALFWADPPIADAVPFSGEDEDRDAAEVTTRALHDLQSPNKLATAKKGRRCTDRAHNYGSGFERYWVDEKGGGRIPIQISAHPEAETLLDATIDPQTGAPAQEFVERYVMPTGELTDEPSEAATRFVPAIRSEVLTGKNVRPIPMEAEDIEECRGIQIGTFEPWGDLRADWPELDKLSEDDRNDLLNYRPDSSDRIVGASQKKALDSEPDDPDERLAFVLHTYYKAGTEYEKGAYALQIGNKKMLHRQEWTETDDQGREISLPLPIAQYKMWEEGEENFYGFGTMDIVGEGNEIVAYLDNALQEHVNRLLNRKVFLPMHSNLQNKHFQQPGPSPIRILPGSEPKYEDIPEFPLDATRRRAQVVTDTQNSVSLSLSAQGLESPQVQSGRHANAIVAQLHASLSDIRQNQIDGFLRACRIQVALARAFFDTETRVGWVGDDGGYKVMHWSSTNLRQTSDVELQPGSMSMLSPLQKTAVAENFATLGVLNQEELRDISSTNLGGVLNLQDNPYVLRVRRQIAIWQEGPSEEWQPKMKEQPVMDPATGQPPVDPATGQPVLGPDGQPQTQQVQAMDDETWGIWEPVEADTLPFPARARLTELSKAMTRTDYLQQPVEWRWGLEEAFDQANQSQMEAQGPQVGQPPALQSPAQRTQGPLAPPTAPVPTNIDTPRSEVEAPDEVVADDAVVEEAVEEQSTRFEEDITEYGPDGPIDEEAEEEVGGEEVVEDDEVADEPTAGSPELDPQPFKFRAFGKDYQIQGAVRVEVPLADGGTEKQIVMTEAVFQNQIHARFLDPEKAGQEVRELEARLADLNPDTNETVIRSRVIGEKIDGFIASVQELAETDPDKALQALQGLPTFARTWELEAKNAILEANANRQATTTTSATEEAKVAEWTGIIDSEMGVTSPANVVDQMLDQAGIDLAPADREMLRDYVSNHRADYYLEATAEHAAENPAINEGDLVRNDPKLIQDLDHQISLMQRAPAAKKAKKVEEANKKKVEGKKVPPTRSAKGKKAGSGSEHVPAKDKDEWRERMGINN